MRRPIVIGLTGNIATGKSEVGRILAALGAHVIDADKISHRVMKAGGPTFDAIVGAFGPEVVAPNGQIDRAKLGAIVFRDRGALEELEKIVHPAVIAEVDRQIAGCDGVVVVEAIKLIEAGMHRRYDELWVVTAPRWVQIVRLVQMRGLTEQEASLRVDAQSPQEAKAAQADRVIENDGEVEALRGKVRAAWTELMAKAAAIGPAQRGDPDDAAAVSAELNSNGREKMSFKAWISRHPRLTAWAVLGVGMVVILVWSAKNVGLLPGQWATLILSTFLVAGLCVWIIGWEKEDEEEDPAVAGPAEPKEQQPVPDEKQEG